MRNVFLTTLIIISISGYSQDIEKFFTPSEILFSNTAINEVYLSNEEKDIFLYANLARKQPKKFNAFYREFVKVRRTKWKELLSKNPYYTSLSSDLLKQKQLDPLYPDKALFELAKCWAIESGERGITGHNRIKCENVGRENCSYGYSKGLDIIMQLLIDEGVESLGHRTNILSNSKGLGTSIQAHTK